MCNQRVRARAFNVHVSVSFCSSRCVRARIFFMEVVFFMVDIEEKSNIFLLLKKDIFFKVIIIIRRQNMTQRLVHLATQP